MVRAAVLSVGIVLGTCGTTLADGPVKLAALDDAGTVLAKLDVTTLRATLTARAEADRTWGKAGRLADADRSGAKRGRLERRFRYTRNEFSPIIERYAAENDVPAEFAHAIVEIESRFRPGVTGRAGEIGLMQIKPATARLVGFRGPAKALYDPETNIKYAMRYLAKARRLGGATVCGTILKYNAGHGARKMNRVSRAYCEKVKAVLSRNAKRYDLQSRTVYAYLDAPVPRFRAAIADVD